LSRVLFFIDFFISIEDSVPGAIRGCIGYYNFIATSTGFDTTAALGSLVEINTQQIEECTARAGNKLLGIKIFKKM
jgi:hypothetical protein